MVVPVTAAHEAEAEWPHTWGQLMLCRETLWQKGTLDELDRIGWRIPSRT